jgi:hypothetical protein
VEAYQAKVLIFDEPRRVAVNVAALMATTE